MSRLTRALTEQEACSESRVCETDGYLDLVLPRRGVSDVKCCCMRVFVMVIETKEVMVEQRVVVRGAARVLCCCEIGHTLTPLAAHQADSRTHDRLLTRFHSLLCDSEHQLTASLHS